jgi:hypothetical protein
VLCHAVLLNQQPHSVSLASAHSTTVGFVQANHYSLASVRDTEYYQGPDFSLSSGLVSSQLWGIASRSLLPGSFRWWNTMAAPGAMLPGVEAMQMQAAPPRQRAQRQTSSCSECRRRKQKVSPIFISYCHFSPLFAPIVRRFFCSRTHRACLFDSFACHYPIADHLHQTTES